MVETIQGDSVATGEAWDRGPVKFMFIDGLHSEAGCRADWAAWSPHLSSGAVICWHDYTLRDGAGVYLVVDSLVEAGELEIVDMEGSMVVTVLTPS